MTFYIVEVSQPAETAASRIAQAVRTLGSHFAACATWQAGARFWTGTLSVDADDEMQALAVVPPIMRAAARVFLQQAAA